MVKLKLEEAYLRIIGPKSSDHFQFVAIPISKYPHHRIAKDKLNNPVLLISITKSFEGNSFPSIVLENVSVSFDVKCVIKQKTRLINGLFTVVSFIGQANELRQYFFKLMSFFLQEIGQTPSRSLVRSEIQKFIELFRLASVPSTKSIQGLWAELFVIAQSKNPIPLLNCWHSFPEEKYDFNDGKNRIEIKSTSTSVRSHKFSIEQLNPPRGSKVIIISLFVRQSANGKSLADIQNSILAKISSDKKLIDKLNLQIGMILGSSIGQAEVIKFDWYVAKDSIRYYTSEDIPKITLKDVPASVTEVYFTSNLSSVKFISNNDLKNIGGIFKSLR